MSPFILEKSPFILEMSPFLLQKLISSICHRFCIRSIDRDECTPGGHLCDIHAVCINNIGSYQCQCNIGFSNDPNVMVLNPYKKMHVIWTILYGYHMQNKEYDFKNH